MSKDQKQFDDLTPFEAALAGLAPRVESFDRERLIFLAGRAAGLRECGAGANPARRSRWAWPAAFSAMTTVAAGLLAVLCMRPAVTVATSGQKDGGASIARSATAAKITDFQPQSESRAAPTQSEENFADANFPGSDPVILAALRRHGIDFGRSRAPASDRATVVAEAPMTYFELLSRLQGKGPAGQGGLKEMMQ